MLLYFITAKLHLYCKKILKYLFCLQKIHPAHQRIFDAIMAAVYLGGGSVIIREIVKKGKMNISLVVS